MLIYVDEKWKYDLYGLYGNLYRGVLKKQCDFIGCIELVYENYFCIIHFRKTMKQHQSVNSSYTTITILYFWLQ